MHEIPVGNGLKLNQQGRIQISGVWDSISNGIAMTSPRHFRPRDCGKNIRPWSSRDASLNAASLSLTHTSPEGGD